MLSDLITILVGQIRSVIEGHFRIGEVLSTLRIANTAHIFQYISLTVLVTQIALAEGRSLFISKVTWKNTKNIHRKLAHFSVIYSS